MSTTITDRDRLLMSQLAYYSLTKISVENRTTVKELAEKALVTKKGDELLQEIAADKDGKYAKWTIDNSTNQNSTNGLRAILVGTGDGQGIVAYAGTEGMFQLGHDQTDMSDNVEMTLDHPTKQQTAAAAFLEKNAKNYSSIDVTGHSKGGNDAMYAALMAPPSVANKINDITTYNAPGFSDEILRGFKNVSELNGKITQYCTRSDIVNALLMNKGLGKKIYIDSNTEDIGKTHLLDAFKFDGYKPHVSSEQKPSFLAESIVRPLTFALQGSPEPVVQMISTAVVWIFNNQDELAANIGKLVDVVQEFITSNPVLVAYLAGNLVHLVPAMLLIAAHIILAVIVIVVIANLALYLRENLPKLIKAIGDHVKAAAVAVASFFESVGKMLSDFFEWLFEKGKEAINWAVQKTLDTAEFVAKKTREGVEYVANVAIETAEYVADTAVKVENYVVDKAIEAGENARRNFVQVSAAVQRGVDTMKQNILSAASSFCSKVQSAIAKTYASMFTSITTIYGSAKAALDGATKIMLTLSRLDELTIKVLRLRESYSNNLAAINEAISFANNMQMRYGEHYVRTAVQKVLQEAKSAKSLLDSTERALDNKREELKRAVDTFKNADIRATGNIKAMRV